MSERRTFRSEGHRRLAALQASSPAIASEIGAARSTVGAWRTGAKTPTPAARASLEEKFGIPAAAWTQRAAAESSPAKRKPGPRRGTRRKAAAPTSSASTYPELEDDVRTNLEHLDALLVRVREAARRDDLLPGDLAKLSAEERRLTMDREKLLASNYEAARIEMLEHAFVTESPAWGAFREAFAEAIRPLVDSPSREARAALEALAAAFEELAARMERARE